MTGPIAEVFPLLFSCILVPLVDGYDYSNLGWREIPDGAIGTSESYVSITRNFIEEVDFDQFQDFYQIVSLNMKENLLESIPNMRSNSGTLEQLMLTDNRIRTIPTWLNTMLVLRELILDKNQINGVPDMNEMVSLQILNLAENNINTLEPDVFTAIPNLQELQLSQSTRWPDATPVDLSFDLQPSLQKLILSKNNINTLTLTCAADNACQLTELDLGYSNITEVPRWDEVKSTIQTYSAIYTVNLLTAPTEVTFDGMPSLVHLNLNRGAGKFPLNMDEQSPLLQTFRATRVVPQLSDEAVQFLSRMTQLTVVELGFQILEEFPDLRRSAGTIEEISIRGNTRLDTIVSDHLAGLHNLRMLDLQMLRNLRHMEFFPIDTLTSLETVQANFMTDQLDCHCSFSWMKEHVDVIDFGAFATAEFCATPVELVGRTFEQISVEEFGECPVETTAAPAPTLPPAPLLQCHYNSATSPRTPLTTHTVYARSVVHCAELCCMHTDCTVFTYTAQQSQHSDADSTHRPVSQCVLTSTADDDDGDVSSSEVDSGTYVLT